VPLPPARMTENIDDIMIRFEFAWVGNIVK
jgi:hypothetical protein